MVARHREKGTRVKNWPTMVRVEELCLAISNLPSGRTAFAWNLPNATLFPQEAEKILRQRLGFYWAKNRLDLLWVRRNWKDMVKWNPLEKVYLYRDEESAAEDMAFIFFQVWNFPVESPLYVTAASFHTDHHFEHGKRID